MSKGSGRRKEDTEKTIEKLGKVKYGTLKPSKSYLMDKSKPRKKIR